MKVLFLTASLLAALPLSRSSAGPEPLTIHVAPEGNDGWSGALARPNEARSDGPLASLEGARDRVRKLRREAGGKLGPVTVSVAGGMYRLERPFVLEPEDSGTADAPVTYAAAAGGWPVFSGGRVLTGFREKGALWECDIPEVKAGKWYFRQLFVGGKRRPRARSPDEGYFRIAGLLPGPRDAQGKEIARDRFRFRPGDIRPFGLLADVNIMLFHSWETSIHPVKSVDAAASIVEFTAPLKEWWTIGFWEKEQRYIVENAFECLDRPGEWYLNRATGVLSYFPLPGEKIGEVEIVAPVLDELARIQGNSDRGRFVDHVSLKGLGFHHSDWRLAPGGNSSTQAAVEIPAAVVADGARNCAFEDCEVAHVGTYGVWFRRGAKDCRIERNRLFDLGAGGIRIGEERKAETDASESSRNLVDSNHIFDGGHVYPAGVGIWVAQSSGNRISHNEVHDLLYSGISIGWNWDDAPNRCHHNLIEANHVHHLVKGVLSDAGAIYSLGASPGSVIRGNLFHDIWPYAAPPFGWGIYLDATSSGYLVEDNIVYNTRSGGLMYSNGGHEHIIQNNIFAFSADHALWPYFEKRSNVFRRNIVLLTQGNFFVPLSERSLRERLAAKESLGVWDENLYWHTGGPDRLGFFHMDLEEWRSLGMDGRSLVADPMFIKASESDFRLSPGSPALKLGFRMIDTSEVGLRGSPAWVEEGRQVRHPKTVLPAPPPPPAPREVDEGFEETAVGDHPAGAQVSGEEKGASIRVSDEKALNGKKSLKVVDSKILEPSWQPHFYYQQHILEGTIQESFDVWLSPGAEFFTEWRDDTPYPDCIGPSVRFDGEGNVFAGGKALAKVPLSEWVHVEIRAAVGKGAPRQFRLAVGARGAAPQVFPELPMGGKGFRAVHWLGFSSTAARDVAFYLDDVQVKLLR